MQPDSHLYPRISIVTPSYNQAEFIEKTIQSVLIQAYPNFEYIIIDGGSLDGSVEIIRKYESHLFYWVSEPDRGQAHAINKGLSRATGEIFAYLNSDDLLERDALSSVARAFGGTAHPEVVFGKCNYIDRDGNYKFTRQGRVAGLLDYIRIWDRIGSGDHLTQPEVFCRTSVIKAVGGFREDLRSVMDFDMWIRLLSKGCRFQSIEPVLAEFRSYSEQKSSGTGGSKEIYRVVHEFLKDDNAPIPHSEKEKIGRELETAKAKWLLRDALSASENREQKQAIRNCRSALATDPGVIWDYLFWTALAGPVKPLIPLCVKDSLKQLLNRI